ncbi:uncharacterized protein LACBIDRAFT_327790 [Laccaria bicolor S238N-H82]|uniref:Predicted protein n=1 Tax=Laccaria bicolor (strain S238N-H82 / ATCC MYA-4686) TaxID=486041 RepID=B0DCU7_LACBS|nr:uncharacterized protein LACBIDRAFT_327790 [Laccaria bicolor S238N-H82]EDR07357.1 predicted protein [Laccaria bicolor S238N-H82]|eukprot:XP_001881749.1 predicted protein [Laccaria bicolor S238N-H82]
MDPEAAAALQAFITYLHHQREFADYMYMSATALVVRPLVLTALDIQLRSAKVYDYLLNIGREIKMIWFSSWTYTKVLYFIVRYLPFLAFFCYLRIQLMLGVTKASCEWVFPLVTFVMMIRTWAVWHRDMRVGILFAALCCLYIGLATVGNVRFVRSIVRACDGIPLYYSSKFPVVLIFTAASAIKTAKAGSFNHLSSIIHRDGIIFYMYLLVGSIANVIFFTSAPLDLHVAFVPQCMALYAGLTSRVVLNIPESDYYALNVKVPIPAQRPPTQLPCFPQGSITKFKAKWRRRVINEGAEEVLNWSTVQSSPPIMAEAALQAFITYMHHQREFADYMYGEVSGTALMIYDYLLNVNREIQMIWRSPWSYTKVLYFIVRYLPFLAFFLFLWIQVIRGVTRASCEWVFPVVVFIMMIRTWAVWHRDKRVGILFAALCCLYVGLATVGNVRFIRSLVLAEPPIPGFRGCFVTAAENSLTNDYIMLVVMESPQTGSVNRLTAIIYRDGILFYLYLLVRSFFSTLFNGVMTLRPQLDLHVAFVPHCMALYSGLTSRVVLNIREVAYAGPTTTGLETQLHDIKDEEPTSTTSISWAFRPRYDFKD